MSFEPANAANTAPMPVNFYSTPDPATHLPAGVPADRYRALVQHAEDLRALCVPFDTRHETSLDRLAAEGRVKKLTDHRSIGGHELPDSHPSVVAARKELERLTAELARLVALDAARSKTWQACGALVASVRAWIRDGRPGNTAMEAINVPAPKLLKNETTQAGIDRLRQQAKELRTKVAEIERAPLPSAFVRARLKEQFAAIAARGEINIDRLLHDEGGQIAFPETQVTLRVYGNEAGAIAIGTMPDAAAMLVFAAHDFLLAAADRRLAAAGAASDAGALTPAQKEKQIAQAMEALFAAETDEATLTLAAWESGLSIEANPGLAPAAWLAVRNVVASAADTSTSPQHAYTLRR